MLYAIPDDQWCSAIKMKREALAQNVRKNNSKSKIADDVTSHAVALPDDCIKANFSLFGLSIMQANYAFL